MSTPSHANILALDPATHAVPEAMAESTEATNEPSHRPHIPRQAIASEARTAWYHMQRATRLLTAELARSVTDVYRTLRERIGAGAHRAHPKAHS